MLPVSTSGRSSVAVTAPASRSTTRRRPPSTVTRRVPSVQARSGSPTPCSWVLVVEVPPSPPATVVGAEADESADDAVAAPDAESNSAAPLVAIG